MTSLESNQVFCHSGQEFAERPTGFIWEGERLRVDKVTARWRTPDGKRFVVRTLDHRFFELEFTESSGAWQIKPLG